MLDAANIAAWFGWMVGGLVQVTLQCLVLAVSLALPYALGYNKLALRFNVLKRIFKILRRDARICIMKLVGSLFTKNVFFSENTSGFPMRCWQVVSDVSTSQLHLNVQNRHPFLSIGWITIFPSQSDQDRSAISINRVALLRRPPAPRGQGKQVPPAWPAND